MAHNPIKKNIIPNLFMVGAPKTGSTSLYQYLAEHPQIFLSADKEPHYFCKDFHDQCYQLHNKLIKFAYLALPEYMALFKSVENEPVVGEASTSYFYSREAAKNIYDFNPDAKIIVLLRNPIELMHSWYHYIRFTSEEPEDSFARALELESGRKRDPSTIPKSVWYPARVFYRDLIQFDIQLNAYFELFGADNVKVFLNEDLHDDPNSVYSDILEFLELEPYMPDFKRHNVYKEIKFRRLKWFVDNYFPQIKTFIRNRPDNVLLRLPKRLYMSAVSNESKRPPIDAELLEQLQDEFRPLVKRTGDLINRDTLGIWGFNRA